jgi:sugar fermentation stimulation protein A
MKTEFDWIGRPVRGLFRERLNRFACRVEVEGQGTKVYLPNSGRLEELLLPGASVVLEARRKPGRAKTVHDLLLVETVAFPDAEAIWAVTDSRMPPILLRGLLERGLLPPFREVESIREEPAAGEGRLDLWVRDSTGEHWIETKSVNLVDCEGVARFPDAPTDRGVRHLRRLIKMRAGGQRTWIAFVVMREDAVAFSPFEERDPRFSALVQQAREAGVGLLAPQFAAGPSMRYLGTLEILTPPRPFPGFWPVDYEGLQPAGHAS